MTTQVLDAWVHLLYHAYAVSQPTRTEDNETKEVDTSAETRRPDHRGRAQTYGWQHRPCRRGDANRSTGPARRVRSHDPAPCQEGGRDAIPLAAGGQDLDKEGGVVVEEREHKVTVALPTDQFDKLLSRLIGLPNGAHTQPTVVQSLDFYG